MTQTTTTDDRGSRSRLRVAAAVAAVVLVAAAALVWYFFIRDDAPPAFDIDDAASALEDEPEPGTTDDSRRDNRMRDASAVEEFPTATFVLSDPIVLEEIPAEGDTISVAASGEMTIKGVTKPVDVTLEARLVDATLVFVGSLPVGFADYGVDAPTSPIALSVEDNGIIEFQVFFQRG